MIRRVKATLEKSVLAVNVLQEEEERERNYTMKKKREKKVKELNYEMNRGTQREWKE